MRRLATQDLRRTAGQAGTFRARVRAAHNLERSDRVPSTSEELAAQRLAWTPEARTLPKTSRQMRPARTTTPTEVGVHFICSWCLPPRRWVGQRTSLYWEAVCSLAGARRVASVWWRCSDARSHSTTWPGSSAVRPRAPLPGGLCARSPRSARGCRRAARCLGPSREGARNGSSLSLTPPAVQMLCQQIFRLVERSRLLCRVLGGTTSVPALQEASCSSESRPL